MLRFISPFKSFFKLMKSFEISNILSKISHTPSYLCIVIDSLPSEMNGNSTWVSMKFSMQL